MQQRYFYDAGNVRMVKETVDFGQMGQGAAFNATTLYPYPGDYERRGVTLDFAGSTYHASPTLGTETQYLVGGARLVWASNQPGSGNLTREQRLTLPLSDLVQSTAAVVDLQSGELLEHTTFYPNGARETHRTTDEVSLQLEPIGFTGKEADEEVGLVYFGERYLIPRLGRWASVDPLSVHAVGGGEVMNGYHYVGGNLLQARDPIGLNGDPVVVSERPDGIVEDQPFFFGEDGEVGGVFTTTEAFQRAAGDRQIFIYRPGDPNGIPLQAAQQIAQATDAIPELDGSLLDLSQSSPYGSDRSNAQILVVAAAEAAGLGGETRPDGAADQLTPGTCDHQYCIENAWFDRLAAAAIVAYAIADAIDTVVGVGSLVRDAIVGGFRRLVSRFGAEAAEAADDITSRLIDNTASAATPVGRRGQSVSFPNPSHPVPRNAPDVVNGRQYSGHAFDRMQERGFTPTVIENAIMTGRAVPGNTAGTLQIFDDVNGFSVIVNEQTGRVITVF